MDIQNIQTKLITEQAGKRATAGNPETRAQDTGSDADTTVRLSPGAAAISQASENTEVFDSDRVAAIKAAIAEGNYPVHADRLAANFIRLESQIIQ